MEDPYGDPDRTVALPTQAPPVGSTGAPGGGNRDPRTQPVDLRPIEEGYSGTGTPLPPVERTDPLPGVPSSGTTRP